MCRHCKCFFVLKPQGNPVAVSKKEVKVKVSDERYLTSEKTGQTFIENKGMWHYETAVKTTYRQDYKCKWCKGTHYRLYEDDR